MGCDNSKPRNTREKARVEKRRSDDGLNKEIGMANAQAGWSNNQNPLDAPEGHVNWGNRQAAPDAGHPPMQQQMQPQYNYGQPMMVPTGQPADPQQMQ